MAAAMASSSTIFTPSTCICSPTPSNPYFLRLKPSSLSTNFIAGSVFGDFSGHKIRPLSPKSRPKRGVGNLVRPFAGRYSPPPPDLPSYLFDSRIVYLGMSLSPPVTELLIAEFMYLVYDDEDEPIYFYINSTGISKEDRTLGYETEALAIYDYMGFCRSRGTPIYTLAVGNAWGEAALLLAAGTKGNRAALPSASIMMKQPMAAFQGQASAIVTKKKDLTNLKNKLVKLLSRHIEKPLEEIEADIRRPKYFSPSEAVEYGIIDKVIYNERSPVDKGVTGYLKKAEVI